MMPINKIEDHFLIGLIVHIPEAQYLTDPIEFYYNRNYNDYLYQVKSVYDMGKRILAELYIIEKIDGREGTPFLDGEHADNERINIEVSVLVPFAQNKKAKFVLDRFKED